MNPPLSPLGHAQAKLVAERLKKEPWSCLYSSDLSRAYQTAEAVSNEICLPIRAEPQLREQSQGKREGFLVEEARKRYPDIHAPEVGRETDEALQTRAVEVYERIRDAHLGERIVIVAHGALMGSFLKRILDPIDDFRIENTSCTLLHWDGENWSCQYLADAAHLESLDGLENDETLAI